MQKSISSTNRNLKADSSLIFLNHEITEKHISKILEIHENEEEEPNIKSIIFYTSTKPLFFLYFSVSLFSLGFIYLLCRWNLSMKLTIRYKKCHFEKAKYLLIELSDKRKFFQEITKKKFRKPNSELEFIYKTFEYKLYNYYFDPDMNMFRLIRYPLNEKSNTYIHENLGKGIPSKDAAEIAKKYYGQNSIEISETPLTKIISDELSSPYFVFPIISCIIWFLEYYQIYSAIILCFTLISVIMNMHSESKNMKKLNAISYFKIMVTGYRGIPKDQYTKESFQDLLPYKQTICSLDLLPGDIIEIPQKAIMPADIILLNGTCIMNEVMLTGESSPVKKNALPYDDQNFSPRDENKTSILYSGTMCLESRYYKKDQVPILGLVYETGFNTLKGQLVRSILYPKPTSFNFYRDSLKFLLAMAFVTLLGLSWTIYTFERFNATSDEFVFACLDMITVIIPPALPTCMSFGIAFALYRLRKKQIYCINTEKINVAGRIDIMCFDKTGTLTEEGLELKGIIPIKSQDSKIAVFGEISAMDHLCAEVEARSGVLKILSINMGTSLFKQARKTQEAILIEVLACCHSLTRVNKELIGDPLDIKMFQSTGWELEENDIFDDFLLAIVSPSLQKQDKTDFQKVKENLYSDTLELNPHIGIIKRFEFSSRLQRMSVIVKNMNEVKFRVHVKGAPEKLRELCKSESIPKNFHTTLDKYSKDGYRVIACASRTLKTTMTMIRTLEREDIEKNLVFLGFLVMENRIKTVTKDVIDQLHEANIRTIMVTGDNILTAISVAKQCQITPPNQRIYFCELNKGKYRLDKSHVFGIKWFDFDFFENTLDPLSLKRESKIDHLVADNILITENNEIVIPNSAIGSSGAQNEPKSKHSLLSGLNNERILSIPTNEELKFLRSPSTTKKSHFMKSSMQVISNNSEKELRQNSIQINTINFDNKMKDSIIQMEDIVIGKSQSAHLKKDSINKTNQIMVPALIRGSYTFKNSQIYKILRQNPLINQKENQNPWDSLHSEKSFSLAISGQVYSYLLKAKKISPNYSKLFDKMLEKTNIYARMKPKEKASLIQELQNKYKNSFVGMCGDGPNDCAALSSADIGISLSETEASIAAPFTSKVHDISCIIQLLREGRCALVTSLQCFKFMVMYSVIQFISVGLLYGSFSNLSNNQYLWIDLFIVIPIALLMGYTKPTERLSKYRPASNLMSFPVLSSTIGQLLIQFGFQTFTYILTLKNYIPCDLKVVSQNLDDYSYCYETTNVFLIANFQYLSVVLAFSIGPPFRKPVYNNYSLTCSLVLLLLGCIFLLLYPGTAIKNIVPIEEINYMWKLYLTMIVIANFLITFLYEKVVVNFLFYWWKNRNNDEDLISKSFSRAGTLDP